MIVKSIAITTYICIACVKYIVMALMPKRLENIITAICMGSGLFSLLFECFTTCAFVLFEFVISAYRLLRPGPDKSLKDDVVLITGGGKGLGRLLAVTLARERKPKHMVLWGRTENTLKATCSMINQCDVKCSYMVCNIRERNMVHEMAQKVREEVGDVTLLINNAGVVCGDTVLEGSEENVEKTFETNTLGQIWCIKQFLPAMLRENHGHIVCMNSMLGLMGLNGAADYVASKFALTGYMESLDLELNKDRPNNRIVLTTIHPYLIDTDMFAGCTTRFPLFFPALEKEHVVKRTIKAILRNEGSVLISKRMYFLSLVRGFLPRRAYILIQKFTGVDKSMDNFHGRQKPLIQQ